MKYDVIIIGGGAAGCMAAITAARNGKKVLVCERNVRTCRKLMITGKGRCNVTNNADNETVLRNIPKNSRFLYSAVNSFSSQDTMTFFEQLGVPLKTERGNRVFPVSDKASDIADALFNEMKKLNVRIVTDRIKSILTDGSSVCGVKGEKANYSADSVILATGGKSYSATGSSGDGYAFAKALGHTIEEPVPSLVPLVTDGNTEEIMGLSLKNVRLTINKDHKKVYSEMGEMLFTHFGISGPLVLSGSAFVKNPLQGGYTAHIDLKPALDEQQLDARIRRDFSENINRLFSNSLNKLLPEKIIQPIVKRCSISEDTKVNSVTKEQRLELVHLLKDFSLNIKNFRPIDEAIITDGGISVKEINPKTMESKLISGLFFAGEIIDVNAFTGGFNLQIAFSTGYAAGISV